MNQFHPFQKRAWLIVAALILAMGQFGAFSILGMNETAQIAFAILGVAALLWVTEAIPLFVTGLLVLFLSLIWLHPRLEETGSEIASGAFLSPFFSNVILLFLGGFVISAALHKFQLDEQMARAILRRVGTSLSRLLLAVMGITAFLSMWLSNTAASAMMLALILPIASRVPEDNPMARRGLILGIPFAANIGGLGIGSPPNAIALQYLTSSGEAPSFIHWMGIGLPAVAGLIVIAWKLLQWMFRVAGELESSESKEAPAIKNSGGAKIVMTVSLLTVVAWMTTEFHEVAFGTVALFPVLIFFGAGLLNTRDFRSLSWDVLFVMGGGLCLGAAMTRSGLADWVIVQLPVDGCECALLQLRRARRALSFAFLLPSWQGPGVLP